MVQPVWSKLSEDKPEVTKMLTETQSCVIALSVLTHGIVKPYGLLKLFSIQMAQFKLEKCIMKFQRCYGILFSFRH